MRTPAVLRRQALLLGAAALFAAACSSSTSPNPAHVDFVVAVEDERFVVRSTDPDTIAQLRDIVAGRQSGFPIGPLRPGHGGFNTPWSWHFDPAEVRVAEMAIEVCDGRPSYVEAHLQDFPSYCPWGARVVGERR